MQQYSCILFHMPSDKQEKLDAAFAALSDSTRRTILQELAVRNDQTLFEICVRLIDGHGLSLSRQAISRHLNALEDADLIKTRWSGRTKIHSGNLSAIKGSLAAWLDKHSN